MFKSGTRLPKIGIKAVFGTIDFDLECDAAIASTRLQRAGLVESLMHENGEKPFAVLSRKVIKAEMKARTPSQAGNLLSALRGMIR
jgi:hypothetical protein